MVNLDWFKSAGLRALQSAAHAFLGITGGEAVGILSLDWKQLLSVSAGAGLVSVLNSIVQINDQLKTTPDAGSVIAAAIKAQGVPVAPPVAVVESPDSSVGTPQ